MGNAHFNDIETASSGLAYDLRYRFSSRYATWSLFQFPRPHAPGIVSTVTVQATSMMHRSSTIARTMRREHTDVVIEHPLHLQYARLL